MDFSLGNGIPTNIHQWICFFSSDRRGILCYNKLFAMKPINWQKLFRMVSPMVLKTYSSKQRASCGDNTRRTSASSLTLFPTTTKIINNEMNLFNEDIANLTNF